MQAEPTNRPPSFSGETPHEGMGASAAPGRVEQDSPDQRLAELLAGLQGTHDRTFLCQIVDQTQDYVFRIALRTVKDASLAEDLTQEVFLTFVRGYQKIKDPRTLRKWLGSVAVYQARQFYADSSQALLTDQILDAVGPDAFESPATGLSDGELQGLRTALDEALRSIDARLRTCIMLLYLEGKPAPEVAQMMGVSLETVYSYRCRALVALQNHTTLRKWL